MKWFICLFAGHHWMFDGAAIHHPLKRILKCQRCGWRK